MRSKKASIIIAVLSAAFIAAAVAAFLLVDVNSYKSAIESALSDALGLDFKIRGRVGLAFVPLGISAGDVHVSGRRGEFISISKLTLNSDLKSLLRRELKFSGGHLEGPSIRIVRDLQGNYNYESLRPPASKGPGPPFDLNDLVLTKGSFTYLDQRSGEQLTLKGLELSARGLKISDTAGAFIKNLSLTGTLSCREVLHKDFKAIDIKAPVSVAGGVFSLEQLTASSFIYNASSTSKVTELTGVTVSARDLTISDTPGGTLKAISFGGDIKCDRLQRGNLKFEDVRSGLKVHDGLFILEPLTLQVFGGKGGGSAEANISGVDAKYKINLKISKLDFEEFAGAFGGRKTIDGRADLAASLLIRERSRRPLLSGIEGIFSIAGEHLTVHSMDLDKVLTKYETSQEFNLVDLGAFFIAGPLSTAALKGYRYGDLYLQTKGGRGVITKLVSSWKIKDGKAEAVDCALSTPHHRVALRGRLNLVSEHYEKVTIAILDSRGCAKFKQPISGPFGNPEIGTVSTIESLAGPIIGLYSKAKRLLEGGKCEVFYNGAVPQPHP